MRKNGDAEHAETFDSISLPKTLSFAAPAGLCLEDVVGSRALVARQ